METDSCRQSYQRAEKTQELIFDSFIDLLKDRTFDEITITDICEKAGIHRTTFYNHFQNKNELFDALLEYTHMDFLNRITSARDANDLNGYFLSLVTVVIDAIDKDKERYRSFLDTSRHSGLRNMVIKFYADELLGGLETLERRGILKNRNNIPLQFLSEFLMNGFVAVCTWWLNSQENISKDDVIKCFGSLSHYNFV